MSEIQFDNSTVIPDDFERKRTHQIINLTIRSLIKRHFFKKLKQINLLFKKTERNKFSLIFFSLRKIFIIKRNIETALHL